MPQSSAPTPVDRKLYGDLADDVHLLRSRGHDVARFKGDFRVDREVLTAAELRGRANAARAKQQAAMLCACGKPASHKGMCPVRWLKRKENNGPTGNRAKQPAETIDKPQRGPSVPPTDASAPEKSTSRVSGAVPGKRRHRAVDPTTVCGCGRPGNHYGQCWVRRGLSGPPAKRAHVAIGRTRLDALEARVAELERRLA